MKTYRVSRNGEVKMSLPMEKHSDGTLWHGKAPLIDSMAVGFLATGKEKIAAMMAAGQYGQIPTDCFAREGVSPSGLEIVDYETIRNEAIAAMTPAQIERQRISSMFEQARRLANSDSDDNVAGPMIIEGKARAALAQWKKDYPAEAKEEKRKALIAKAEHQEEIASGALHYDADGWLDASERQKRHDEIMAEAKKIREEAASL
jgi:hypothetical protein